MASAEWRGPNTLPETTFNITVTCHSPLVTFSEPKPQQTGTGLLNRFGEVATTSGSTNFRFAKVAAPKPAFEAQAGHLSNRIVG